MHYPEILGLCLNAGLAFLKREPLALLMEAPIRLAMQTACLNAGPVVELEVGYREGYGSQFLRLRSEDNSIFSREGEPTNNVFAPNSRETCDIRLSVNGSQCGFAFELKCAGSHGANRNFRYKRWKRKDLRRLFTQGFSKRGEGVDSMIEGAILAASRSSYERVRAESGNLLVNYELLSDSSLRLHSVHYENHDCWLIGGRCRAFGEERSIVCITRMSYLDEPWPAPEGGLHPIWAAFGQEGGLASHVR